MSRPEPPFFVRASLLAELWAGPFDGRTYQVHLWDAAPRTELYIPPDDGATTTEAQWERYGLVEGSWHHHGRSDGLEVYVARYRYLGPVESRTPYGV